MQCDFDVIRRPVGVSHYGGQNGQSKCLMHAAAHTVLSLIRVAKSGKLTLPNGATTGMCFHFGIQHVEETLNMPCIKANACTGRVQP